MVTGILNQIFGWERTDLMTCILEQYFILQDGRFPLLLWGPYLWANGEKGRNYDDLVYRREDFRDDGTHSSDAGQQKIARLILKFFKTDPTAKT